MTDFHTRSDRKGLLYILVYTINSDLLHLIIVIFLMTVVQLLILVSLCFYVSLMTDLSFDHITKLTKYDG